jgi:hypothetical protein
MTREMGDLLAGKGDETKWSERTYTKIHIIGYIITYVMLFFAALLNFYFFWDGSINGDKVNTRSEGVCYSV